MGATNDLQAAAAMADSEGAEKVLPRHLQTVSDKVMNPLIALKDAIRPAWEAALAAGSAAATGDGYVTVRMDAMKFQRVKAILGIV